MKKNLIRTFQAIPIHSWLILIRFKKKKNTSYRIFKLKLSTCRKMDSN